LAAILLIAALDEEGIIAGYLLNMIDGIIIYFFVDPTENVDAREAQRPPPGHPPVDASGSGACPYASTVGL